MQSLSKHSDSSFARQFWKGFWMAVLAGLSIVTALLIIGLWTAKTLFE